MVKLKKIEVEGVMSKYTLDLKEYAALARLASAEGCVLVKNDNNALPLRKKEKVAVFGRMAFHYYKSGLGSGGLVNTRYVVSILDALKEEKDIILEEDLLNLYEKWIKKHPYDEGEGWGRVPWSQAEMPVDDVVLNVAKNADAALIIIGRTAGEDQDNRNVQGSYLLTDIEKEMIANVSKAFERTIVILNVGNIIDMNWVEECNPSAVLYAWQGGQEGGHGVVDVLTGRVNPCGKLTDTIARNIEDYPSTANFGDEKRNFYKEDIYVGYRYFESFAKEKVIYPFGYGLSYTSFALESNIKEITRDKICVVVKVTNTGTLDGKETVQIYIKSPQGMLGKPERALIGFEKTKKLAAGATEELLISIPKKTYASYDDSGVTGYRSCYVLEAGEYEVFAGTDVRSAVSCGSFWENFLVVEKLEEACAPTIDFERIHPVDGKVAFEKVPTRTIDPVVRKKRRCEKEILFTGDKGILLGDVYEGNASLDEFVAQLEDKDLIHMFYGEGMCSPKVTPGTAAAFGGITERLQAFGIPAACCADGPSGIRMDCGTKAFSLPNGTALGCTFDTALVEELYCMLGKELRKNKIDSILGPGLNLHRNPLNGRNFEYISEDPLLTGKIGAAQVKGIGYSNVTGTMKHFCANNQEFSRNYSDSVISERALREIYLKCFEIPVKEGGAHAIMTSYGAVNGIWAAGNYDLCTTILRKEWGFKGIVMTDWWSMANDEGSEPSRENLAPMITAGNNLYMVTPDADGSGNQDNLLEKLQSGVLQRSDLQRSAKDVLNFILNVPAIEHKLGRISPEELEEMNAKEDNDFSPVDLKFYKVDKSGEEVKIDGSNIITKRGECWVAGIEVTKFGLFEISVTMKSELGSLAQLPISVFLDGTNKTTISIQGTEGKWVTETRELGVIVGNNHYLKLFFGADGIELDEITIHLVDAIELPF